MKFAGSNWWSFDFHNHTPASSDYDPSEKKSLTPRDWLLAYMRAGIDCVAVTDHNSGEWIDRLSSELAIMITEQPQHANYRPIHIFPGVELTSSDGIHVIGLFGPEEGASKVHGLLALARYNSDPINAHGICEEGAPAICDHIHDLGGVAVLAHAEEINGVFFGSDDKGKFTPRCSSRSIELLLEKADAIEVHDPNSPAIIHFQSHVRNRALVDGSDAHRTKRAGARFVWIKMAKPNLEGLKLALLDPNSSLIRSHEMPTAPLHRITSLNIEHIQLRRQPIEIPFSPWFTAVIGGRGSGKSTLLEALRLSLARESDIHELGPANESDVVRSFQRFRTAGVTKGSLGMIRPETILVATVEKHDPATATSEKYSFTWKSDSFNARRWDGGAWHETGLSVEQAAKIFPVKVFSQKQIFEIAEKPSALLTYIDRAPEVDFQRWKTRHQELCRNLRTLRTRGRELIDLIAKKAELETERLEVERKTQAFQKSNYAEQVKTYKENEQAQKAIMTYIEDLLLPIQNITPLLNPANPYQNIALGEIVIQSPDPSVIRQVANEVARSLEEKYKTIHQLVFEMQKVANGFLQLPEIADYWQLTEGAIAAYRAQAADLAAQGVATVQEADSAMQRLQVLKRELDVIREYEADLKSVKARSVSAYAELRLHRRKLTKLRKQFVEKVLSNNPNLRITIDGQADLEQSVVEFRSILRLQDGTFTDDVLAQEDRDGAKGGLLGRLTDDPLIMQPHKRLAILKQGLISRSSNILGQSLGARFTNALARLGPDDHDALLEWFPHDLVRVEFRRNPKESFQSLERASAGQKTSSVLSFLLSHGDEPLLLDQPEDDLDNALVSELVVQQIRNNKGRRQIIVVTHNPNIVVNGDAELVLPMEFKAGQIHQNDAGGLQERSVRERICNIMEGGRDAFRQRYKRIFEDLDCV